MSMTIAERFLVQLLLTVAAASAAPIYVNGAPNTDSGNEASTHFQAEDFTLGQLTSLTGARVWAFYFTDQAAGYLGSVEWAIHDNNGGQPGTILNTGLVTPTELAGAANCCAATAVLLEFALPDISLAAGTYWLSLHNGPVSQTAFADFYWQTTGANTTVRGLQQLATGGAWTDTNLEHAFELDGTAGQSAEGSVPEPGTFMLAGFALLAAAWKRKA